MPRSSTVSFITLTFTCLFLSVGCTPSTPMGQVKGTLLIKGKPANKVRIRFEPEAAEGGMASMGDTDESGTFTLRTINRDGKSQAGAAAGDYRVVLVDIQLAESQTGRGVPMRISRDYLSASTTPLRQTVKEGEQTTTITIP